MNQMETAKNLIEDISKGYNVFTDKDVDFFMSRYDCIDLLTRYLDYDDNMTDKEQVALFTLLFKNDYPKKFSFNRISERDQKKFIRKNRKLLPPNPDPYQSDEERYWVYDSIGAMFNDYYCTDINNEDNGYLVSYARKIKDRWVVII